MTGIAEQLDPARDDFWRVRSPAATSVPFKEWQHFIVLAPGLDLILNFNLSSSSGLGKLVRDENAAVRMEAVRGIVKIHAVEAIPSLCTRLRDQDMMVQSAAIESFMGWISTR